MLKKYNKCYTRIRIFDRCTVTLKMHIYLIKFRRKYAPEKHYKKNNSSLD